MSNGGHPARTRYAAEIRDCGLAVTFAQAEGEADPELTCHGAAALWTASHGRVFTYRGDAMPAGIQLGERGKCFANAQQAAHSHGLHYAEGFAGPRNGTSWTLHAWNLDKRHRVIDPTWGTEPGSNGHYFGVIFTELPKGEDAGISVIVSLIAGKAVMWDRRGNRVRVLDYDETLQVAPGSYVVG